MEDLLVADAPDGKKDCRTSPWTVVFDGGTGLVHVIRGIELVAVTKGPVEGEG